MDDGRTEFSLGGNECLEQDLNVYMRTHVIFYDCSHKL